MDPRQEPSALAVHAGICAGGCPSPRGRRAVPTAIGMEKEMGELYIEDLRVTVALSHALVFVRALAKR